MSEKDEGRLERLGRGLARWRARHGGRGRRIPEWVWEEASAVAAVVGVPTVAQTLRLAPKGLAARAGAGEVGAGAEDGAGPAFVELDAGEVMFRELTVEIQAPTGRCARVRGGDPETVARVARMILDGECA